MSDLNPTGQAAPSPWTMAQAATPPATSALFEMELFPHRSLSKMGFVLVMTVVGSMSLVVGFVFFLAGAWPVIGFMGLDILLIYFAFRTNYIHGTLCERIRLEPGVLHVERRWPGGRLQSWQLEPYWTRVTTEEAGKTSRLIVSCKGETLVLGGFLDPAEREAVSVALGEALASAKIR